MHKTDGVEILFKNRQPFSPQNPQNHNELVRSTKNDNQVKMKKSETNVLPLNLSIKINRGANTLT